MNKVEAISRIKEIQRGCGINSDEIPEHIRGRMAQTLIDNYDSSFMYGVEYGEIIGLMKAFNVTQDEL